MNMKSAMRMAALVSVLALLATSESEARAVPSRHLDKRSWDKLITAMGTMLKPAAAGAAATSDDAAKAAALASQGVDDTVKITTQGAAAASDDSAKAAAKAAAAASDDSAKAASQGAAAATDDSAKAASQGAAVATDDGAKAASQGAAAASDDSARAASQGAADVADDSVNAASQGAADVAPRSSRMFPLIAGTAIAGSTALAAGTIVGLTASSPAEDVAPTSGPVGPTGPIDANMIQKDEEHGIYYIRDATNDTYYIYEDNGWSTYCREGVEYVLCGRPAAASTATTQAPSETKTATSMASLTVETPGA